MMRCLKIRGIRRRKEKVSFINFVMLQCILYCISFCPSHNLEFQEKFGFFAVEKNLLEFVVEEVGINCIITRSVAGF